jgi:hypothetical protein
MGIAYDGKQKMEDQHGLYNIRLKKKTQNLKQDLKSEIESD